MPGQARHDERECNERPLADNKAFCEDARMRSSASTLISAVVLASCAPKPVYIAAEQCWSVSVGDKVEGTAILSAYSGSECIECGASVSGHSCPGVGFAAANNAVDQAYDRIVHSAPADNLGFVSQRVFLSGDVIPNGATGKPMIRATQLRLAEPKSANH